MIIAGNSHVSIFRGRIKPKRSKEPVKVKWIGAITAGHFLKNHSSAQTVRSIFLKTDDWKILSIGMHDIFLLCGAYAENRYEEIFDELISCYKNIFLELNSKGKFGWLISPQQLNAPVTYGLPENSVFEFSQKFNEKITNWCVEQGIAVINPLNKILGKNYLPKKELLQIDRIHLNDKAIKYYIKEINKKTRENMVFVSRDKLPENTLQANTEPESLSLLVADELGLFWDHTKLPHGTRKESEKKLIEFLSGCLLKKGIDMDLERDSNYNQHNQMRSADLVELYTYASEMSGGKINFDVNIRELNTVEKISNFIFQTKPLTKNDFFETLTPDTTDKIRRSETLLADFRIASMHDDMYMHFKEIIHLQTGGTNFGYGIIYFWFALVEAARDNYGLALNLLENAEDIHLRFPFQSFRIEYYRDLWEEKLVEQQKRFNKKESGETGAASGKYDYSDFWWPAGKFGQNEDDLLLELKYRGKEITQKIETIYAVGVYDFKKCKLYFDIFKYLKKICIFMPVPEIYEQLKNSAYHDARIEVFPYGITDMDGHNLLVMDIKDSRLSLFMGKQYHSISGKTISVECQTIEKIISSNHLPSPDMIIYDILGMEHPFYSSISPGVLSKIGINYIKANQILFNFEDNQNGMLQRLFEINHAYFGFAPLSNKKDANGHALFLNKSIISSIAEQHQAQKKILGKDIPENFLKKKVIRTTPGVACKTKALEKTYQDIQAMIAGGSMDEAVNALEKFIEINPDHALAHNDLGVFFYKAGRKKIALEHYEEAVKLEPQDIIFQKNLADFYFVELERVEEALKIYVSILTKNPQDLEALFATAHICGVLNRSDDAIDFYNRILQVEPGNVDAMENLNQLTGDQGEKSREPKPKINDQRPEIGNHRSEDRGQRTAEVVRRSESREQGEGEYLVSAIVSTYNAECFIRGRLQNLVDQTLYKKNQLEIIVIDSNSPQNEKQIVGEFKSKCDHIEYLRTFERETVYGAWNRGIEVSKGRYIINANTDDRFAIDALQCMADELEVHSDIDAVYGDWVVTKTANDTFESETKKYIYRYPEFFPPLFFYSQISSHASLMRKDVFDRIGLYDKKLKVFGDRDFMFRFSAHGLKAKKISRVVGLFLENPTSLERSESETGQIECVKIYEKFSEPENFHLLFGYDIVPGKDQLSQLYADAGSLGKDLFSMDGKPLDNVQTSLRLLIKAFEMDHTNVMALNNLGVLLAADGRQSQAIKMFEGALQNSLEHEKSVIKKNLIIATNGSIAFDDFICLKPDHLNYHISIISINRENLKERLLEAEKYLHQGRHEEAQKIFGKELRDHPDSARIHNGLGMLCYSKGIKEKALNHYRLAAELEQGNITFQKNLADIYYVELGMVEEAMKIYVRILNANPDDVETLLILGHICVALKKFDDAKVFYNRVLKAEPLNKDARQFLEELEKYHLSVAGSRLGSEDIKTTPNEYLVSAIVSTYNSERFIRGCLEDLERQTIADRLEIIVVNSGSDQNEDKIIKEFQGKYLNIKYIKTDQRETVYKAWNRGIKAATGKYITNANTDDRHRKDAFEVMTNTLETRPEIVLIYADVLITETENEIFENCTPVGYFSWRNWKREELLNTDCFIGPQPMWRRNVHDEYGYFDDSFVTSGDYEFWLRISQTNTFLHLPVQLGLYLRSPGSIEHLNREKKQQENNKIFNIYSESHIRSKNNRCTENDLPPASEIKIDECVKTKVKVLNPSIQVSIIIPISNQQKYIKNCVKRIQKHTPQSHEIIFVNNGVPNEALSWLKRCLSENTNYRMIKCQKDSSFAEIYNQGIKASTGEYILLLSNDTVVAAGWLSGMLECLKRIPDAGVVGPMSNISRGLQKVSSIKNASLDQLDEFSESFMNKNRNRRILTFSIDGFCMLFGRNLVEKIGLFDEKFGFDGYEDGDFCLRALLEGRKNLIAGDVYVHQQSYKSVVRNKKYFNTKWNKADTRSPSGKKYLTLAAIEKGGEVYQRGNIDGAVEILLEGIRLSPGDKKAYYALAEILLHAKNYKDAIDILNEMPQDEKDVKRLELLGYCNEGMDLNKEAIGITDQILTIDGHSATAQNLKGILAFKQDDIKMAEEYFNKAIELDPGYGEPHTNLGAMHWEKNKNEAINLFEKGFILSPTSQDIISNYHSAIAASGEFTRAEQIFEEASLLHKNNKIIRYQLIDVLIKQRKNVKAMHQIEDAIALFGVDNGILSAAFKIRELLGPKEIDEAKNKKHTVSLCMIVKNEEEYLPRCLKSVKPVIDEMILVDTGSTDRTKEIAKVFGAKVYDFKWTGDFSEARNYSLSKTSGSWTFHLDADEVISSLDYEAFRNITRQPASKQVAYLINTRNYTMDVNQVGWTANDGHYEKEESATGWTPSEKVRLFRNESNISFEYPIHEVVEPSIKRAGIEVRKNNIPVHHYGKLNNDKSKKKIEVYYQIGRKKLDETEGNAVAIRELAIQAEIIKKHDEAIELWERFIAIEPRVARAYINMGISYCSLGKYEKVLETAKKAMTLEPDLKEAHYNYALGKLNLGSAAEAVSILKKLLNRLGEYPPAQFLLAAAYCCDGKKDQGIIELRELQKTSIGQGLSIRCQELAKGFVFSKRYDYALMLLEAAIESKSSNKDVLELYFKCLKKVNDNEKKDTEGITLCDKGKNTNDKSDPDDKVIAMDIIKLAKELNQRGQTDHAIKTAMKAISRFPKDKQSYYFLAQILINAKRYKDAFDILNERPQDEKDVRGLELIAYCQEGLKQYDEAKNFANQALLLNPSSASAINLKGVLAYNQGDNARAEDFFNRAIESDPGYGEPYTNLGAIRWKENHDEALNLFEKGFILSPQVPDIVTNYHAAASAKGEFKRAEKVFREACSSHPNNKMIRYQLIDVFIKQEKNEAAMKQVEEAIVLFGVDDGIISAALKIRDLLGPKEIDKAKEIKSTISLCMIVKNEEKHLARCLNSLKSIVDEMIVVDTGSTDMTKDIAKSFGAKVYDFKWNNDFSKARNYSISRASGKWNLIMDADEVISPLDYNQFKKTIEKSKPLAYQFTTRNYTLAFNTIGWKANNGKYIKENAGVGWTPSNKVRLFPNMPGVRFEYPIHELIEPSLQKTGLEIKKSTIPIHHYGKLNQKISDDKGEIYYQIGRKKLDETEDSEVALCELAIQAEALGKHEESIELWERLIKIKPETALAFVNMGTAYAKLGKYENAVSAASRAIEIDPEMVEAHYNYAFSKVHLGQVKEAILILEKMHHRFSGYPPAQFLLTVAYCLEAREVNWLKGFEKLRLTMGCGLAVACHEFAKGLLSARRPEDAVVLLGAAIKSKNSNKEIEELYSKCQGMIDSDKKTGTMGDL